MMVEAALFGVSLERLGHAIWWSRRLEREPARPWYLTAHGQGGCTPYYQVFPIRLPKQNWSRAPNMQQIPRRARQ